MSNDNSTIWSPKIGDRVRYWVPHSEMTVPELGTVLSVHGNRAWVKFDEHVIPMSPLITNLRSA